MMSLLAMSFGDRFCVSRKGRTGGGGCVHPKGANSMAVPKKLLSNFRQLLHSASQQQLKTFVVTFLKLTP